MDDEGHRIFSLAQAAAHVHVEIHELCHFAQRGDVPSIVRGDDFFFEHKLLDEWAQRRMMGLADKQLAQEHRQAMEERRRARGGDFHVSDLLSPTLITCGLSAHNRAGVLRDMVDFVATTGLVYDPAVLYQGLVAREEAASTAVGGGAAFLHARFHDPYLVSESFLAIGRSERPVFFGAQDGAGTDLFFLICCTDHKLHLHALARLCLMAHGTSLFDDLRAADGAEAIYALFSAAENNLLQSRFA